MEAVLTIENNEVVSCDESAAKCVFGKRQSGEHKDKRGLQEHRRSGFFWLLEDKTFTILPFVHKLATNACQR